MTDTEFLSFIRECALSNEDIAEYFNIDSLTVRSWRNGSILPDCESYNHIIRELAMLEHTRLSEQIQNYHALRFPGGWRFPGG
jgi:hypothetical protein